jgi:alkanesulfonate monooxygenase SsuD/methylene tetrahydromethanopterin reductase-like flavin-dependent oxidoreductase (luciferase family)
VRLGTIHLAQPFRAPSVAAKMAATLDVLSGGRLIFFYDCGWQEAEVRAYGLPWPAEEERIDRMDEGLRLIDALWRAEEPLDFQGRYFSTRGAVCRPGPVQRPRPPIWLGEARHHRWCDTVVRHADGWNSVPASPARLGEKLEQIRAACRRIGRDPAELEISLETQVLIAPTEAEARAQLLRMADLPPSKRGTPRHDLVAALRAGDPRPLPEVIDEWLVGTPEQIIEQIRAYEALGVSHFMLWFIDFPSLDGLNLFAERVMPHMRGSGRR